MKSSGSQSLTTCERNSALAASVQLSTSNSSFNVPGYFYLPIESESSQQDKIRSKKDKKEGSTDPRNNVFGPGYGQLQKLMR